MNRVPAPQEMERAFHSRDASYDGVFFTAVRTTGVFCRPSCPARKPLSENILFFLTAREALFAGYRPCLRCRPLDSPGSVPDWVQTLLDRVEAAPETRMRDADLRALNIEPERARRYFLKRYGMTFQAYSRARRLGSALKQIREGAALDDVALTSGYESHSGFRDAFLRTFGDPPGRSRSSDCIVTDWIETAVGPMLAGANSSGICLLEFTDRRLLEAQFDTLRRRFHCAVVPGENSHTEQLREELAQYFTGSLRRFHVPLVYPGTPFQERVWNALLEIPYGETRSYEQLALRLSAPKAIRAVGTANGRNRIAIVIPCHRVVNKNGELGGYGGGLWRKQFLLSLEQAGTASATQPHQLHL